MSARIDPWGATVPEDYAALMREFGIKPFSELTERIPDPHLLMRRGVIFGHRDFDVVLEAMLKGKKYAVMTGLMPSGRMHMGHKLVIDQLIWYQKRGAEIFLCVADLEAYSARDISFEESKRYAIEEYLANYIALGLDLGKCRVYFQSKNDSVKHLAYILAKEVNFSEMRAIYGFANESNIAHIFYPMIDAADILHPQLEEFCGPCPTVVPVGIDQDPHLRLARDVAARVQKQFNFIPPSSTYHRLIPGIKGGKMSSSRPESAIFLTDSVEDAKWKIENAFTGGRATAEEHRRLGGQPDICVIYALYVYQLIPDDEKLLEVRRACTSGEMVCGECKAMAMDLMSNFLRSHQAKLKGAREKAERIAEMI
jgi:tryptophanyl-tRNA synthetase